MEPLMYLKGDDTLEDSLLKATHNEPAASLTPAEATLLGEDHPSQEAWETTTCPADHPEETPEPKVTAGLEWAATDPQDFQGQMPPLPLGFGLLPMSGQPPLRIQSP